MSIDMEKVNQYIHSFAERIQKPAKLSSNEKVKVGVDLGTANIVLAVLNEENKPIAGSIYPASVVRDGLVVDYVGAVDIVKNLKKEIEAQLGLNLTTAAGSVPPGTMGNDKKAIKNILESAMFDVSSIIDEPTAAASVLGIQDGAVVDVGGGTTGISILQDGEVIYTADEPTGGTHMSLTIAGYYDISFEEAEARKKDKKQGEAVFPIIKPVVEKMASITKRHITGFDIDTIYIVGGSSSFHSFTDVFTQQIGISCLKPVHPLFITPLGIAMNG
ncbi:ethanolamine utilization protein EutJ [Oceanobacillus halophilus]|uniref:Chaperone protein DnaK n=1 Tax=Oceanobacillus halophilus TaxID=930130 RepID=A0A494ZT19_9BACI|nr:ethanolamine utilization protein EutJ [Oceanobacillus halophilus]RKQ29250.1 ethanolamine utilization protein EutJ [Oceanobacillus halophilus]